jgi:hypothetical protein
LALNASINFGWHLVHSDSGTRCSAHQSAVTAPDWLPGAADLVTVAESPGRSSHFITPAVATTATATMPIKPSIFLFNIANSFQIQIHSTAQKTTAAEAINAYGRAFNERPN